MDSIPLSKKIKECISLPHLYYLKGEIKNVVGENKTVLEFMIIDKAAELGYERGIKDTKEATIETMELFIETVKKQ